MRRLFALLIACWVVCAALVGERAFAAPALTCSNPTVLTGYEGTLSYPPYVVQQDVWQQVGSQTMSVCSASSWKAVANQSGAPATGVKTYPDSQRTFTDWSTCASQPPISSFTKLKNTYGFVLPKAGSWDATTDVFTDGAVCGKPLTEIMVIHKSRDVDFPTPQDTNATIAGIAYNAYHASGFVQLYQVTQRRAGTFNLLAVLKWCQAKGYLPSAATMTFDAEGVEVLTTFGVNLPFTLNAFSVAVS